VQATLFYQFWSYFTDVRGFGAVVTTLQFAPFVIGMLVGTMLIVRLSTRFGARRLITGGLILMSVGLVMLSRLQVDTQLSYLILPITLLGLGLGLSGPARTSVILSAPPPRLMGSGAAINSAAGQSGYALGVILSSLLVTTLADNAFHVQLRQANLSPTVMAQIDHVWENTFARAMSGNYARLPVQATQWVTGQFAPAFTTGLANTLLVMAGVAAGVAFFIFVGMERGLKGSLMQPPDKSASEPQERTL
jgi:MFS family permease